MTHFMKIYLKFRIMHNNYKLNNLFNYGHSRMVQWIKSLISKSFDSWDPHGRRKEITMQKIFWSPHVHCAIDKHLPSSKIHLKMFIFSLFSFSPFLFTYFYLFIFYYLCIYFILLVLWDIVFTSNPGWYETFCRLEWPQAHCNLPASAS